MSSYRLVKQDVAEARRLFCRTLTEISSSEESEIVVVIEKRGEPLAAIISLSEAAHYFAWKAAEIRRRAHDRGEESIEETSEQIVFGEEERDQ